MASNKVKVVLLGDTNVGKSSIAQQFVENVFRRQGQPTMGASFAIQTVQLKDRSVKLEIWDTAGQEKYRSLAPLYYQGAQAALIVFDITNADSFENVKYWVSELREAKSGPLVIAIGGNKLDRESERTVSKLEAEEYANSCDCIYGEMSARTGDNIRDMFAAIAERSPSVNTPNINIDDDDRPETNCCSR